MQLSSQMLDRIVGHSEEPGRQAAVLPVGCRRAQECRQVPRISFGQRTQIRRDRGKKAGVWETVVVKDISTRGIGILSHDPIDHGDTFVVKLTDQEGQTIRIRCKIERCERGGFGSVAFLLGATFQQVIQQEQLQVNDEERLPEWRNATEDDLALVSVDADSGGLKLMSGAMARAVHFLRAVDPVRAASQWLRKADDFSSVG